MNSHGEYLPDLQDRSISSRKGRSGKIDLPAVNEADLARQTARTELQGYQQTHDKEQKEIEKMKALISVYNELYCQTTMEYNQLAEFVGVKLDSSHDGNSNLDSVSQLSSAAISARNRMNLEIRRRAQEDVETTKSDA